MDSTNEFEEMDTYSDSDTNPYCITYEELFDINYMDNIEYVYKSNDKLVILDNEINKKLVITRDLIGNAEIFLNTNPNIKILNRYGYKIGDYVEIDLFSTAYKELFIDGYDLENNCIHFNIDTVCISIRSATDIYSLIKDVLQGYDMHIDKSVVTISFEGVNNINYSDYIYQTLFLLDLIKIDNLNNKSNQIIRDTISKYKLKNIHCETFHFYSEGIRLKNYEIASLYFYKVIEYFFAIVRTNEFVDIIESYNKNKDIEAFVKSASKIYDDKEEIQVIILVNYIKEELNDILLMACHLKIISSLDYALFAQQLYLYRNSIVHGKNERKFELKLPNIFNFNEIDMFWRNTLQFIAKTLIMKFCLLIER